MSWGLNYVTAEQYYKICEGERSLEDLKECANNPDTECENCSNLAWKLAQTGLCFTCTTGEADASEDYELC